ncbi:MAG: hypothetical protein HKUEN01_32590 [Candidatus Kuenenia stuttgartiensis]|nr:MAG: hypothetical protein HKUEN01_32590 [Candidatus Kuenenia stuttgartiensis]
MAWSGLPIGYQLLDPLLGIRSTAEYCGKPEIHDYQLYQMINDPSIFARPEAGLPHPEELVADYSNSFAS